MERRPKVQIHSRGAGDPVVLRVQNLTHDTVLCACATVARGILGRGHGLLGRHQLGADEGMLFEAPLRLMWMHTFFMAFPIDIVFLDRDSTVIRVDASLKPWRLSSLVFGAHKALETTAGAAARTQTVVGDRIGFEAI